MKNIKHGFQLLFLWVGVLFLTASCDSDDNASQGSQINIEEIRLAANDSVVTLGSVGNLYIIRGSGFSDLRKIYFNETETYFNPTLVTDQVIFVSIAEDTPYIGPNNELRLETEFGSATFPFPVAPPAPTIQAFNPINAQAGDTITISGTVFVDPEVTIDEVPLTVLSSTLTSIQVVAPSDIDQKYLTVNTIGGSAVSRQATGTAIYDDALLGNLFLTSYGVTDTNLESTDEVRQGQNAIKFTIDPYSGFGIGGGIPTGESVGLRFSIRGTQDGAARVVINYNYDDGLYKVIDVRSGIWTDVFIPWEEMGGKPDTINEFLIGEFSGLTTVYHLDDIGFALEAPEED